MADPKTSNILLSVPTRGSDSGTWDTPVNGNSNSLDGRFGGVQSVSLTNTNITLSGPSGTTSPGAGPTQAENAVIQFSGTLTGNVTVTIPTPGFALFKNNCGSATAFYIQLRAAGTGNMVGCPPGRAVKIWNDGTNCDYGDPPEVGSYMDLAVATTPVWFAACTVKPWLVCDGSSYSAASYTALFQVIGQNFGGAGSSFNVPDLQGRYRIPLDNTGARITAAGAGFAGNTLGTSGGAQNQTMAVGQLPAHTHAVTDPGHTHGLSNATAVVHVIAGGIGAGSTPAWTSSTITVNSATTNISLASTGSGQAFTTIPPALVAGLAFIKT